MPFERNRLFISRETELSKLEELLLQAGQYTKVAITGLGGVGKTQISIELIYRIIEKRRDYSVFWIPATDPESLLQAYLTVAQQLNLPGRDEEGVDVKRLVQNYLSDESAGQWLLVFDNADDMDMWMSKPVSEQKTPGRLLDYLPKSKQGRIVFTSRDRKVAVKLAPKNVVEVREMNSKVAAELLHKCLAGHDLMASNDDTEALMAELTYLPLAIIQASAYIKANGVSIADYLSLLAEQDESTIELLSEDFEDDDRYQNIKNPVATTWLISFERIQQRDPLAADYLSFMACIEPKEIPKTLLPEGPSRKKEMDAIGTLDAYSFITKRGAGVDQVFDLHRLVHLATRNWIMEKGLFREWVTRTIRRLGGVFPSNEDDRHKNRALWRKYLPHARYVLSSNEVDKNGADYTNLAWGFGLCLNSDGRFNEAGSVLLEVMKRNKTVLGPEHHSTLNSMTHLASIYYSQGQWKKAEELQVQVKDMRKRMLEEEHTDTLTSMNDLALTYKNQGWWKEAEELQIQVKDMRKRILGEEHPYTLISMNNLALTYMDQGRWKEAEELQVQVKDMRKRILGGEHPSTLNSMNNLAGIFQKQGRWKEAEELQVQVKDMRKRILGGEHPDTLISMNNLAVIFKKQGLWKEAEELQVQVKDMRKRILGEEHPKTLNSINNLAKIYINQGRWKEAEELKIQVKDVRKKILEKENSKSI